MMGWMDGYGVYECMSLWELLFVCIIIEWLWCFIVGLGGYGDTGSNDEGI